MSSPAAHLEQAPAQAPARGEGLAERVLALAGDLRTAPSQATLLAFLTIGLFHLASERAVGALRYTAVPTVSAFSASLALGVGLCAVGALALLLSDERRWRAAAWAGFAAQAAWIAAAFPNAANHDLLVLLVLGLCGAFDLADAEERRTLVRVARWLTVIVLFTTGLQKLLYGTYLHGEYLGFRVAHSDTFAAVFQYLLPEAEFQRLRALGHDPVTTGLGLFTGHRAGTLPAPGAGPYRVAAWPFLLASNGVVVFELVAPFLLMWRRTRAVAVWLVVAFLLAIELGAREYYFGGIFVCLVLTFASEAHRRLRAPFALFYFALFVGRLGGIQGVVVVSLAVRRRIAVLLLALLAAWPLAHRALVERYGLDPWRYFGFAMYCYPKKEVRVDLYAERGGEVRRFPARVLPEPLAHELRRFRVGRRTRGTLRPDALADRLRTTADADAVRVEVRTLAYDVATARFRETVDEYRYEAPSAPDG